jgi:hypothetical protein
MPQLYQEKLMRQLHLQTQLNLLLTAAMAFGPAAPAVAGGAERGRLDKPDVQMTYAGGTQFAAYERSKRELEWSLVEVDKKSHSHKKGSSHGEDEKTHSRKFDKKEHRGDPKTDYDRSENRRHSEKRSHGKGHSNPNCPTPVPPIIEPEPFMPPVDPTAAIIRLPDWRTAGSAYNADKNRVVTYLPRVSGDYKKLQLVYQGYSNTLLYAVATVETQLAEPPDLREFELTSTTSTSDGGVLQSYSYPGLDGVTLNMTYDISGNLMSTSVTQIMILSPAQIQLS